MFISSRFKLDTWFLFFETLIFQPRRHWQLQDLLTFSKNWENFNPGRRVIKEIIEIWNSTVLVFFFFLLCQWRQKFDPLKEIGEILKYGAIDSSRVAASVRNCNASRVFTMFTLAWSVRVDLEHVPWTSESESTSEVEWWCTAWCSSATFEVFHSNMSPSHWRDHQTQI